MKKVLLIATIALFGISANAQSPDFGVTAGYLNARGSVKAEGISVSASESGFYAGVSADFEISENFHIQPELLYASVDGNGAIMLPVVGKFYIDDKFNVQAGPQFVFSTEDTPDDFSSIEFDLAGGLGYDITDNIFAEARYTFQINNSYTGDEDIKVRGNYLMVGIGYKF